MEDGKKQQQPKHKIVRSLPILGSGAARLATPSSGESSSFEVGNGAWNVIL